MKRGQEIFSAICESLTNDPTFKKACAAVGIAEKTFYQWIGKSQQGDPDFLFYYLDSTTLTPLHVAVKQACTIYHQGFLQDAEQVARFGLYRKTYYKGQPQFERDPALDTWTDEQLNQLGMDRYLRDENGKFIPVMEWHPPSDAKVLAVLQARHGKLYSTKISHDVNQKVSLGVTVVQPKRPEPVTVVSAPALPAPEQVTDAEFTEAEPDLDFLDEVKPPAGNPEVKREASPLRAELEEQLARRGKKPFDGGFKIA
jgi:hypothetical protein